MTLEFPATYSRMIARELALDASGVAALLAGTRLTASDLFAFDSQISLLDQYLIIRNGLAISGNPALGLQVGSRMPLAAHGSVGAAASSAANMREAFNAISRYQGLRAQFVKLNYYQDNDAYRIDMHLQVPLDEVGLFLIEAMMASSQWVIEFILGRPLTEAVIRAGYPAPPHASRYSEYLQGSVSFGHAMTSLEIPAALLDSPNHFGDPEAHAQAILQCERLEAASRPQESWPARVTRLLQQHPGKLWTLPEVADALHVSTRTLVRHLHARQTSYQTLLDEELRRQAFLHFESTRHTVTSVAAAIGYQDVSAFRRAFKRWTGETPQDWLARKRTGTNPAKLAQSAPR